MPSLGEYLALARRRAQITLRQAQGESGISNAYLSQLENGRIQEPSPLVLEKLATLYRLEYATLMQLAGYPLPASEPRDLTTLEARLGPTTNAEQDALIEYLDFLRSKRRTGGGK